MRISTFGNPHWHCLGNALRSATLPLLLLLLEEQADWPAICKQCLQSKAQGSPSPAQAQTQP